MKFKAWNRFKSRCMVEIYRNSQYVRPFSPWLPVSMVCRYLVCRLTSNFLAPWNFLHRALHYPILLRLHYNGCQKYKPGSSICSVQTDVYHGCMVRCDLSSPVQLLSAVTYEQHYNTSWKWISYLYKTCKIGQNRVVPATVVSPSLLSLQ